jgi:DNA invertase Pin-like site-specific DNA recombinase
MKASAKPVGYLRVSRADEDGRTFEEQQEGQRASVARLAARNGHEGPTAEYIDWDRSADEAKEKHRTAFLDMLAAVERGEVSAIYARSLDRLYRSMGTFTRLSKAATTYGVRIETEREGVLGGDGSPMAQAFAQITAVFAELELETAKSRARSRVKRQREAGMVLGQRAYGDDPSKPGEDVQAVVDAFREAGSYMGAVRLLIERRVPSRRSHLPNRRDGGGGMQDWSASTVTRIIARVAPELVPQGTVRGSRTRATHRFQRLLICPSDESVMTSMPRPDASTAYLCRHGHRSPPGTHPRPWVIAETRILAWAKEETAGIFGHTLSSSLDGTTADDIASLHVRRERVVAAYLDANLSEEAYKSRLADIDAELDRLAGAQRASLTFRLGLDWSQEPAELNARLRELWAGIRLAYVPASGTIKGRHTRELDLVPTGAIWRVEPEDANEDVVKVAGGWFVPSGWAWRP